MIEKWLNQQPDDNVGPQPDLAIGAVLTTCEQEKDPVPTAITGWSYKNQKFIDKLKASCDVYHIRTTNAKYKVEKRTVFLNPKTGAYIVEMGYVF